jgi:hypothetical protein
MLAYSGLIDNTSHSKSCALVYTSSTSVATTSLMLAVIGRLQSFGSNSLFISVILNAGSIRTPRSRVLCDLSQPQQHDCMLLHVLILSVSVLWRCIGT